MSALVLALNPSIDVEWRVAEVRREEKNVIQSERRWAGGKGVNVARWLRHLGGAPKLLLPLGGVTGKEFAAHLRGEHLPATTIRLREATRVNVIITTKRGGQLRFNPPGPELSATEWRQILSATEQLLKRSSCLVLSGSLPRGVKAGAYAELIRLARRQGVKTILDCDGDALAAAVGARPFLVKPNEHELAEWSGRRLGAQAEVIGAASALSAKTKGWVLVSLGSRGALLVNQELGVKLTARCAKVKAVNTVGAGDALVGAVTRQIELSSPPEEWLRLGVATGTAATLCAAGKLASKGMIQKIASRVKVA